MKKNKNDISTQSGAGERTASKKSSSGSKKYTIAAIIILIAAILCCLGYIFRIVYDNYMARQSYGAIGEIASVKSGDDPVSPVADFTPDEIPTDEQNNPEKKAYSPIDLPALQKINGDVYAWIRIPNTYIDYPIAQSGIEDNYYLHRSMYRRYLFAGMIYTQSCNKKDFSDPITVIYGHNMRSTTMFSTLHYFQEEKFFNDNEYFKIYTLDRVLTYRIISAYKYDNRHIMNSFDFSNPKELANYQKFILNPTSVLRHVRPGIELDEDSKIVVLSTCVTNDKKSRFLVNGVLISDVPIQK